MVRRIKFGSPHTMNESFITYRKARYLWLAIVLSTASIVAYLIHEPLDPPNGGTWLGYTLGGLAAFIIVLLSLFGVRKRRYHSRMGTVRGWLSAHVYLGLALIVTATLHAGFQLGWNVHSLAYLLMCIVVISGFFGTLLYQVFPNKLVAVKGNESTPALLATVKEQTEISEQLAAKLAPDYLAAVSSANQRTVIGGSAYTQLFALDQSKLLLPSNNSKIQVASDAAVVMQAAEYRLLDNAQQGRLIQWLTEQLVQSSQQQESEAIRDLLEAVRARQAALRKLRKDIQVRAWLNIWLYLHVPLSIALLVALTAHVLAVFIYW